VVNDLTKWIAAGGQMPYVVIATAASMNGYASANIAPAIKGIKRVIDGTVPRAIIAVPSVIENAPPELTGAGLGDVIAKPVSMTDWTVNKMIFGEYYCPLCARLIADLEPAYMKHPGKVVEKDPATIGALFNALVYSGISMTLAGTSFPASGGEHLPCHVLDMIALRDGTPHDYHGRQVGLGTIFAAALYQRLLEMPMPEFKLVVEETDVEYWGTLAGIVEGWSIYESRGRGTRCGGW
jgi:glycerol-1-phosphate dehydrogenase [NAD(P)+]